MLAQTRKDDFGGLAQFNCVASLLNCVQAFASMFY